MTHDYWRTLDERIDDPAFQERLANEFPSQIEAITDPVQRRTFLKLMGASMALAGVTAAGPESRIPNPKSREFWRTLDELEGDPAALAQDLMKRLDVHTRTSCTTCHR